MWKVFRIGTVAHVCACVTGLQHSEYCTDSEDLPLMLVCELNCSTKTGGGALGFCEGARLPLPLPPWLRACSEVSQIWKCRSRIWRGFSPHKTGPKMSILRWFYDLTHWPLVSFVVILLAYATQHSVLSCSTLILYILQLILECPLSLPVRDVPHGQCVKRVMCSERNAL